MTFRDLKQGYPIHLLDKSSLRVTQGKVVSAGFPRLEANPVSGKTEMVVDISIEEGGKTASYVIPEGLAVTYAGNLVISTDKAALVGEVEALKASAEQILASMDRQKDIVAKSSAILAELSPAFKEKKENDKKFSDLEAAISHVNGTVAEMKNTVTEMKGMFEQIMAQKSNM